MTVNVVYAPLKEQLHWLPISDRIEYKVLILKAQLGVTPKYL